MRARRVNIRRLKRRVSHGLMWLSLALAAALAAHAAAHAQSAGGARDPDREPGDYVDAFNAQLDAAFATGEFAGLAVAVVEGGDLTVLKVYGETVYGSGERVTPDTVFRLASVSKGFASTLVGMLVDEGRLEWEDKAVDHAPRFALRSTRETGSVSVADLASHRTGLPAYAWDNYLEKGVSVDDLLDKNRRTGLVCRPATCYAYQNITYSLLADVAEDAGRGTFAEQLERKVFEPLGMYHASVGLEPLMEAQSWARPHARGGRKARWRAYTPNEHYYRVAAAGGLNASVYDLIQWVRAQLGHEPEVLNTQVLTQLHAPVVETPTEVKKLRWLSERLNDADYALGWRVYDYAGERMVVHAGGVSGYRSMVAMLPEHDLGIAILWNSSSGRGWRIMPTLMDLYLGLDDQDWLKVNRLVAAREARAAVANGSP